MRILLPLLFLASLSGCATERFSNRVTPTLACDKLIVASMWGYFGITTEIDPKDAAVILAKCKAAQG